MLWYRQGGWLGRGWYVGKASAMADCQGGTYAIRQMAAIPPDDVNTTTSWEVYNNGMFPTTFGIVRSGP